MATFNCVFVGSEGDIIETTVVAKNRAAIRVPKYIAWGNSQTFTVAEAVKVDGRSRWGHAEEQAWYKARRREYRFLANHGYIW